MNLLFLKRAFGTFKNANKRIKMKAQKLFNPSETLSGENFKGVAVSNFN